MATWTWFHKWGSPKWFYGISGKLIPWLGALAFILMGVGLVWGLGFAPADYQQGDSYRIIYIHVPSATLAMSFYALMAMAGAISLIWKMKLADMVAKAAAPIGASLTILALATGSIWGKPTWGTWWIWDARLTSMLLLFFLYVGVIALRSSIENQETAAKASSLLAIVGVVNLVIIKYSVVWWNTLHQSSSSISVEQKAANPPEMWVPLVLMIFGFYCFFGAVLLVRTRAELLNRERRTQWVEELVMERFSAKSA